MRNNSAYICGQRRPRSACASAQSNQNLYRPQTESVFATERFTETNARLIICACAG